MSVALKLYERLTEATDDRERFRLIADAIGALEDDWPRPGEIARAGDLRETELRLLKEIEGVRKDVEDVRKEIEILRNEGAQTAMGLRKDIEGVRKEIELVRKEAVQTELGLRKEIEEVRLEIERVRREIGAVETRLHQALHRQTVWIIGAVGAVVGLIRLLDYLLA